MECKFIEILFFYQPVFHDLRRQFHKITIDTRSRQGFVSRLCQHTVQGMTELMEESFHFVESEQRRRSFGGTCKIHHDGDMRTAVDAVLHKLRLERGHPCTRAFSFSRMEVGK